MERRVSRPDRARRVHPGSQAREPGRDLGGGPEERDDQVGRPVRVRWRQAARRVLERPPGRGGVERDSLAGLEAELAGL